jgi:hypothetical protein
MDISLRNSSKRVEIEIRSDQKSHRHFGHFSTLRIICVKRIDGKLLFHNPPYVVYRFV